MKNKTRDTITTIFGTITLVFVILKLTKVIDYNWMIVLSPAWIGCLFTYVSYWLDGIHKHKYQDKIDVNNVKDVYMIFESKNIKNIVDIFNYNSSIKITTNDLKVLDDFTTLPIDIDVFKNIDTNNQLSNIIKVLKKITNNKGGNPALTLKAKIVGLDLDTNQNFMITTQGSGAKQQALLEYIGENKMNAKQMWNKFKELNNIDHDSYDAWAFGSVPDKLANLVLQGLKTATASCYPLYEVENEAIPPVGGYNVILDSHDNAVCVIKTTKVTIVPFNQVSEDHAYKEGEGDRSLAYWREVHQEVFTNELKEINQEFTDDVKVVLEEFEVVYK